MLIAKLRLSWYRHRHNVLKLVAAPLTIVSHHLMDENEIVSLGKSCMEDCDRPHWWYKLAHHMLLDQTLSCTGLKTHNPTQPHD